VGRAHDVELHATGLASGPYRVAEVRLSMPEAVLPWAIGAPDAVTADLAARVEEAEIEGALAEVVPLGGQLRVDLVPHVATIGTSLLPMSVDVRIDVDEGGTVWLRPVRGAELFERLGLGPSYASGDTVRVETLEIGDGELRGVL